MLKVFESLRGKLLFSFGLFLLLLLTVIVANIWQQTVRKTIDDAVLALSQASQQLQEAERYKYLFLSNETINPKFYITGYSEFLDQRRKALALLSENLEILMRDEEQLLAYHANSIDSALWLVNQNVLLFDSLAVLVKVRGFKNWGLIGEMRRSIHRVEDYSYLLGMEHVLMARRHEKDFLLRKDLKYQELLKEQINVLQNDVYQLKGKAASERPYLLTYLHEYDSLFEELVNYERLIGFDTRDEQGLRYRSDECSNRLREYITHIGQEVNSEVSVLRIRVYWGTGIIMLIALLFGVLIALFISKALGEPFETLSESIHQAVASNFDTSIQVVALKSKDEIGRLSKDVSLMLTQVQDSIKIIRNNSQKIENKQKQLLDSLYYAEQIQQAILPDEEDIASHLPASFLIYKPQHVVSGDFYWLSSRKGITFFAVVDCTGHGVPGAFMSMIGYALLNKIVVQSKILAPEVILEALHLEIVDALKQRKAKEGTTMRTNEGMDVSLCSIEQQSTGNYLVTFSGAKQSLFYTQGLDSTILRIKGTSRSIGELKKQSRNFEAHQLDLPPKSSLYLCTDGFADQHNEQREKFGSKRLVELFSQIALYPLEQQKKEILDCLSAHQGSQSQRDDITIWGVRL